MNSKLYVYMRLEVPMVMKINLQSFGLWHYVVMW